MTNQTAPPSKHVPVPGDGEPQTPSPFAPVPEIAAIDSERIDIQATEKYPKSAIDRHILRYEWAAAKLRKRFVRPGRVIDFACGTGYGSAILASVAHEVYGRDKDPEAVRVANVRHSGTLVNFKVRDRIERHWCRDCDQRKQGDVNHKGCTCILFDAVVSIETIEHLEKPQEFVKAAFDLLIPNGMLALSTPLKDFRGPGVLTSHFHLKEYSVDEINALVESVGFVDLAHESVQGVPGFIFLTARRPA